MAAKDTKKKRVKHPKGFAQLPEWWMEMTPHNTLDRDEDATKRRNDNQEKNIFKTLAKKSDWEQKNGDSKYTVGQNGELIDKSTGKAIETGKDSAYSFDEKTGDWLKEGKPIFGRQFESGGGGEGGGTYGHQNNDWEKPQWMKVSSNFSHGLFRCQIAEWRSFVSKILFLWNAFYHLYRFDSFVSSFHGIFGIKHTRCTFTNIPIVLFYYLQVKLKSTSTGDAMKKGDYIEKKYVQHA